MSAVPKAGARRGVRQRVAAAGQGWLSTMTTLRGHVPRGRNSAGLETVGSVPHGCVGQTVEKLGGGRMEMVVQKTAQITAQKGGGPHFCMRNEK